MKNVLCAFAATLAVVSTSCAHAIDPVAVEVTQPSEIKWVRNEAGTNESCIIQVWGMGPATSTPAEKK